METQFYTVPKIPVSTDAKGVYFVDDPDNSTNNGIYIKYDPMEAAELLFSKTPGHSRHINVRNRGAANMFGEDIQIALDAVYHLKNGYAGNYNFKFEYYKGDIITYDDRDYLLLEDVSVKYPDSGDDNYFLHEETTDDLSPYTNIHDYDLYPSMKSGDFMFIDNGDDTYEIYSVLKDVESPVTNIHDKRTFVDLGKSLLRFALGSDTKNIISIEPGYYRYDAVINTPYTVITSTNGQSSVRLDSIDVQQDSCDIIGIDTTNRFKIGSNLTNNRYINCIGRGNFSFNVTNSEATYNQPTVLAGYFLNCRAIGFNSFGCYEQCAGTFENCVAEGYSFGAMGTASGKFYKCRSQYQASFGGSVNSNAGGGNGVASGDFIHCVSSDKSFGGKTASGKFVSCIAANCSFGSLTSGATFSGKAYHCVAGNYSFGGHYGTEITSFTGEAYYCIAGNGSFCNAGGAGSLTGQLYGCIIKHTAGLTDAKTFKTVSGSGITRNCIDGNNAANNQG